MSDSIKIWKFDDAPECYKMLSTSGGDEDWIAFIPNSLKDEYIPFLDSGSAFGYYDVQIIHLNNGEVRIGSHA